MRVQIPLFILLALLAAGCSEPVGVVDAGAPFAAQPDGYRGKAFFGYGSEIVPLPEEKGFDSPYGYAITHLSHGGMGEMKLVLE
jgi:hypothetical protein